MGCKLNQINTHTLHFSFNVIKNFMPSSFFSSVPANFFQKS